MTELQDVFDTGRKKPYIIAEIGINARNDLVLAKRFIDIAAESGADAVKFQTHIPSDEMVKEEMEAVDAGGVYDTLSDAQWSMEEHRELKEHASENGVEFLSTPFSVEAVELLEDLGVPGIKIGSGEMTDYHLLKRAATTDRPLIVSTGMHSIDEVKETHSFLDELTDNFALLYCVSKYPTSPSDFDLGTLKDLQNMSDTVGFSDHSLGAEASKIAICNGAKIIEKHFTIDRRLPGSDQDVSIEPDELSNLCSFADLYHETSGSKDGIYDEEDDIKEWAQHSVVTTENVREGEEFCEDNLTTKRPGTGLSAKHYFDVIGKVADRDIPSNSVIHEEDVR